MSGGNRRMKHELKVNRDRLGEHAEAISDQTDRWRDSIPNYLSDALPPADALPSARSSVDLYYSMQSIHELYSNNYVPGIASIIFEVSEALSATVKNYGDAEIASTPIADRPSVIPRRSSDGGQDIGDILHRATE